MDMKFTGQGFEDLWVALKTKFTEVFRGEGWLPRDEAEKLRERCEKAEAATSPEARAVLDMCCLLDEDNLVMWLHRHEFLPLANAIEAYRASLAKKPGPLAYNPEGLMADLEQIKAETARKVYQRVFQGPPKDDGLVKLGSLNIGDEFRFEGKESVNVVLAAWPTYVVWFRKQAGYPPYPATKAMVSPRDLKVRPVREGGK